ncbi:MAG: CHAT domain-containing protein [Gammaproteobacteria bacterium]|nr:CHAT domain-containing protein [Woeseia sp.]MBT8102512.1 CHAT domain-containing protein [Gammaproteobacteria bacterium]
MIAPFFLWITATVRAEPSVPLLLEGRSVTFTHGAKQLLKYSFEPRRTGAYLVQVTQGSLDLQVSVSTPGVSPQTYNSPSFRDDRETVLLERVSTEQTYTIGLKSDEYTGATATHQISISIIQDEATVKGFRLMTAAAAANRLGGDDNWGKALSLYTDALRNWQDLDNKAEQARTLLNIANLHYWQFASWLEAADSAASAATLYADLGDSRLYANAVFLQAVSLIEAALATSSDTSATTSNAAELFDLALHQFDSALQVFVDIGDEYGEARTENNIGLTHYYMDNWSAASGYFKRAASKFRRQTEWSDELNPLANLAVIDFELGRFVQAVESLTRLLELIPADQEPEWRADALDNLGASLLVLGRVDDARKSFFEALALHEKTDSAKGQGRSLTGLGSTYFSIGELELAQEFFERALPVRKQSNDGRGQVAVLHFLGDVHRKLGNHGRALYFHDRALNLAVTPMAKAKIEILLARDEFDAGRYDRAGAILQRVNDAAHRSGASAIIADSSFELGRTLARLGNTDRAQLKLREAHSVYEEIGSLGGQAQSLLELARISRSAELDTAIGNAYQAIALIEQLRGRVANPELRAVYLSTRRHYYDFLIDTLMQSHVSAGTTAESSEYLLQALSVSERARARATVDLMGEAAVDIRRGMDPELKARQNELYGELAQKQYVRDQLLDRETDTEKLNAVVTELQDILAALDVLDIELRESNPRSSILNKPDILKPEQIQEQLDDDSVVLQFWLGDSASYMWIVSRTDVRGAQIADRKTVDRLARQVYESLSSVDTGSSSVRNRQAALVSLSELILGPAANEIDDKSRIIVAADGSLQYVPFSLLLVDGHEALINSHEVVVVPSISSLAAQRSAFSGRPAASRTLAAIGDPVFESSDPRVAGRSVGSSSSVEATSAHFIGLSDDQANLFRLPFSAMEIERIAALVAEDDRHVATGFAASRRSIIGGEIEDYRIVHFGTHGLINARHPALSTLVFSLLDEAGRPSNGFLRLHDIYNLELAADLVVLSACETGLGREIRGEGLVGLTQGFMYAGARSVIASLWRVSDRATAELMTQFYKYLLQDGLPPANALRRAQRDMANERRWRDPYFWSGFVLHGDWT